jgi:hypothetical protein
MTTRLRLALLGMELRLAAGDEHTRLEFGQVAEAYFEARGVAGRLFDTVGLA